MNLCRCGCGEETSPGRDYRQGHYAKHVSNVTKAKGGRASSITTKKLMTEFGAHGTPMFAGISEADYLSTFQSLSSSLEVYEKMRRSDSTCQACLLVMELPILSTKFFVRPASNSSLDKEIAAFIEWNLFDGMTHTFGDFMRQALGKFWAGFSWFEKVFEPHGSMIKWRKFASRAQNTLDEWILDDTGGPEAAIQSAWRANSGSYETVSIPIEKLLVFVNRQEAGNLHGTSFFRAGYKNWLIKDNMYRLEAISMERSAVGIPVMVLPRNASADDKAQAKEIVTTLRRDEKAGVTIPENWQLYLLGGGSPSNSGSVRGSSRGGSSLSSYQATIQHHDLMLTKSILAQFINLPGSAYGSYALSADQSTLLLQMLNYEASQTCKSIDRYAIEQLVRLNWPKVEKFPSLDHSPIGSRNIKILASAWNSLSRAGLLTPSPETERYIRETIGFPMLEAGAIIPDSDDGSDTDSDNNSDGEDSSNSESDSESASDGGDGVDNNDKDSTSDSTSDSSKSKNKSQNKSQNKSRRQRSSRVADKNSKE